MKNYDVDAALQGLQQLKSCLEGVQVQANTFIQTIQGAADENTARNIKTLVETFEDKLKAVVDFFENELVSKSEQAVNTIVSIVEANG